MKTLYTIGDSFTYGDELDDPKHAWPYVLGDLLGYRVDNLAQNGASNDYILATTVEYLENNTPDCVIIAWTTEDRIDIGGKSATSHHDPHVFRNWDKDWARKKLKTQILTMEKYILRDYNSWHCATWIDPQYFDSMDNYIGRFVEWVYGMPHGIMGHPLQQGHERIAHEIVKRFRD